MHDEIGELFDACDKNGDGTLTMLEAMRGFKALQKEGRLAMLPLEEAGGPSEAKQASICLFVPSFLPGIFFLGEGGCGTRARSCLTPFP